MDEKIVLFPKGIELTSHERTILDELTSRGWKVGQFDWGYSEPITLDPPLRSIRRLLGQPPPPPTNTTIVERNY